MQPCFSYPYNIQVLLLDKVSQFLSFVEKGTGIEHSEDQLGSYWSPPGMDYLGVVPKVGPLGFHHLAVLYG